MNTAEFSSEQIMKYLFTATAVGTRPTSWYVALHTDDPTLDGSANEVAYTNYARQSATFTADQPVVDGPWRARNDADVTFPATDAQVTVTHVTVFDALTGGNALAVLKLPLAKTVASAGVFSIPANELVLTGE